MAALEDIDEENDEVGDMKSSTSQEDSTDQMAFHAPSDEKLVKSGKIARKSLAPAFQVLGADDDVARSLSRSSLKGGSGAKGGDPPRRKNSMKSPGPTRKSPAIPRRNSRQSFRKSQLGRSIDNQSFDSLQRIPSKAKFNENPFTEF